MLNSKEVAVLKVIQQNPFLSQAEIAHQLNINRSTIATIISSLTAKHYLKGKAYIVNDHYHICCIGAMNLDRSFHLSDTLYPKTSNPVTSTISVGGVARNVAENLGRLNQSVALLSLAGRDTEYQLIKERSQAWIGLEFVQQVDFGRTSSYTAVLDPQGEMQVAFSDMAICQQMNREWVLSNKTILKKSRFIIVDLNLAPSGVETVIQLAREEKIPLALVPVSGPKMKRLPQDLHGIDWLVVNQDESEDYFHKTVQTEDDFVDLAHAWLERGVQNIVITRGIKPSIYSCKKMVALKQSPHYYQPPQAKRISDVTGAGDSFVAGLVYGILQELPANEAIHYGLTNAYHTVQTSATVRQDLDPEHLKQQRQQIGNCRINPL